MTAPARGAAPGHDGATGDIDAQLTTLIEDAMTGNLPDEVLRSLITARLHYRRWMRTKEPA